MALPPDSVFRGVAAAIPQPASEDDVLDQLALYITGLTLFNDEGPRILYRHPDNDQDIREAVFRWDTRPPEEIFHTGFTPRPQDSTREENYYNLEQFVNGGGSPADTSPFDTSVFVSTTRSAKWRPLVPVDCILYRYQIYAPGGIDAVLTLRARNNYPNQQEISFAGGSRPQYIRFASPYTVNVEPGCRFPLYNRLGNDVYINDGFNPNPTLDGRITPELRLRNPTCPRRGQSLIRIGNVRNAEKRDVEDYVDPVCRVKHYIESAFNFSNKEEAYLFIADQCLLINYAPGTTDDQIMKGPLSIGDGFPYLEDTIFASGIDAAFTASSKNEAYIFRSNIYALINFAEDGGSIIQGPNIITDSFYYLKNTNFENGIDAAFASSRENEAYIFKGDQYALINFAPGITNDHIIQGPKKITLGFPSLEGTIFQDGLDAAFSSTAKNEAYLFKGDTYALINYAPGTTKDYIINGPITPISEGFHSLKDILPMYPCGC
ncbi:hypothetical protein SUGI_0090250 [Cryptomeria japonica]|uniref:uncharacterized protein LOC131045386 n=1 Tax=Cryptomeria japonica TaxID=3369 RepID=UPI002408C95B|nr:uncharacterized protein LOC131045386 [Cryptomeria japonica]XP_057834951.2 uncharacterized protein LOC131045386 [Cryptomeria japonica]GLJ08513.1 hypothetical protein SUGI_0090250 [Cryptomeria japonica]